MPTREARTPTALFAIVLLAGCASSEPRLIEDLYREALDTSRERRQLAGAAASEATRTEGAERPTFDATARLPLELCRELLAPRRGPRITDLFIEASLREAVSSLALQAQVEIALGDAVEGRVNARIDDLPLEAALDAILPAGVVWVPRGRGYLVAVDDPSSPSFAAIARTHLYRPRHLAVDAIRTLLPPHFARYTQANNERNLMTLFAPPATLARVLTELAKIDRPVPQVEIEAIICEISPHSRLQTGVDFEGNVKLPGGKAAGLSLRDLVGRGAYGPAGVQGLESFDFASVFMKLLAHEGYVAIRAAPRIRVQDGDPARILIGDQTFFTVTQGEVLFRELRSIESGIVLELKPRVMDGGEVFVQIQRAEVSDEMRPTSLVPTADGTLPTVATRRVQTSVQLRDGETIVLGGLVRKRQVERVVKVPLLGDIPLFGLLFQRRDSRDEETEVAIFLTARIVR